MADYSDVLDEATLALISEIDQIHRSEKPQDTVKYVNSLMSLGRHLQLQEFRSWLNHKCGLPITVRPSDVDLKEYMETAQIEEWIHEWTQKHATDRSGRMLSLFLQHEFQVNVKDTMKPCNGCDQPYSTFLLIPMRTYKDGTYDPSDYHLFCYTCCTTTSGLLSPGHWLRDHPEHQAHQRLLAMKPATANISWRECELRALEADRGYIPPTWYLAVPPQRVPTPDQAIILHTWDEDTKRWIKLPMTKANETMVATQYSVQEWQQLVHSVYQSRKFHAQEELKTGSRASTYRGLRDALQRADSTITKRQAKRQLLEHQEFLATSAGTDIWTLDPNDLAHLVAAFKSWEDVNAHLAVSGTVPLDTYVKSKDSTAHLKDFLEVILPNLHQHYICRNTQCSFVIQASHWFHTTTETRQGSYLCPKCLTVYRPWAGTALRNPNKKFCPAAQCLVTKSINRPPPGQDGWAQKLANHAGTGESWYLYLMKFPTENDQELLTKCKTVVDSVAQKLSRSDDPHSDLLEYINTVLAQAQPLPYFGPYTVDPKNIKDVQDRNGQGKKHKIKWEHLPKSIDPATKEVVYRFQGCPYEYDEDTTKVLEAEDVHQLIGLIFCKVYLTRFLQLTFKARKHN